MSEIGFQPTRMSFAPPAKLSQVASLIIPQVADEAFYSLSDCWVLIVSVMCVTGLYSTQFSVLHCR